MLVNNKIGINDISLFLPKQGIKLESVVANRSQGQPDLEKQLRRAVTTTGQTALRFPEPWEDTATLAAQAILALFSRNPACDTRRVRYLAVGTETTIDQSKPVAAYVQGMLSAAGVALPGAMSTFQVQHACAGGALALLSAGSLLAVGGRSEDTAVVCGSDIAHYRGSTTAEITQGAGAAALHIGADPRLIELDLASVGYHSQDVDDFFRPLGQKFPEVKGGYSIQCYNGSLQAAFADACERQGKDPATVLKETAVIALHTPFRNMPNLAMTRLLKHHLGLDEQGSAEFLERRGFYAGIDPVSLIGNVYSGSVFFTLAFALADAFRKAGTDIVGKRVLIGSYGSGSTMAVITGTVAATAPEVIGRWELTKQLEDMRETSYDTYLSWMGRVYETSPFMLNGDEARVRGGSFYLKKIREDGYREYSYKN